ncbi:type IV secretion system protein VirB10 [Brucella ciceri]|uniref:type IV secretion system protein VirB10 n=1 Tax=Brucella TaxID=234 RepID=UPI0007C245E5|nr:type IV secretion system protein VirB10 [Brucella ciceri]MCH6205471.1 type IV secretion system protein VirB10 [Brucella ciceri]OAB84198.1 type IV secretion system protein VirB10 [Brucella intermedia]
MADEEEARIPGERTETITDQRIDSNPAVKRGAIALAVVAFIAFAIWSTSGKENKDQRTYPERVIIRQTNAFEPAKEKVEPVAPVPAPKTVLPIPTLEPVPEIEDKLLDSARRAPVLAYSREQGKSPVRQSGDNPAQSIDGNFLPLDSNAKSQGQVSNDEQRFDSLLRPTLLEGARAGTLGNRNFIVAMGNSIPCVLETALASDQPGFTSCVIDRDVLSDNGRVVLMKKGTQVVGEYRGGLQRGQKRLLVLWNRAKTPEGVIITLASPATDALGRSGFDGHVDRHWWERFGSALLLSIVGDTTSYASSRLQNSGVEAQDTMSAGQQAAAIAVEKSIDIPPTLNKHQGEVVSIFVARDLDFSDVYRLRVTEPKNRIFDRAILGDFKPESKVVTK